MITDQTLFSEIDFRFEQIETIRKLCPEFVQDLSGYYDLLSIVDEFSHDEHF
jgi:hypothetical protein